MSAIFFVHIPKTAGTSFRKSAENYFGSDKVVYDYSLNSAETSEVVASVVYGDGDIFAFGELLKEREACFLSGHVPAVKYVHLAGAPQTVTFLRDPIQRVVSEYHHFVRHNGYEGDFPSFYRQPQFVNRLSKLLNRVPLEAIGFLGLTEDYARSLDILNDRYSTEILHVVMNTGRKDNEKGYEVPQQQLSELQALNESDLKLYEEGVKLFNQRKQLFNDNLPYVHGAIQGLNKNSLQGWAWHSDSDSPVDVDISLDGRTLRTVKAQTFRPGLLQFSPPRNGYVGFQLKFPEPLKPGVRVKVVVSETGQVLGDVEFCEAP